MKHCEKKEKMMGQIIVFPRSVTIDRCSMLALVTGMLSQHVEAEMNASSIWTRKELLVSLVESLIQKLEITRKDIRRYKKMSNF